MADTFSPHTCEGLLDENCDEAANSDVQVTLGWRGSRLLSASWTTLNLWELPLPTDTSKRCDREHRCHRWEDKLKIERVRCLRIPHQPNDHLRYQRTEIGTRERLQYQRNDLDTSGTTLKLGAATTHCDDV